MKTEQMQEDEDKEKAAYTVRMLADMYDEYILFIHGVHMMNEDGSFVEAGYYE
ncbi:hypothetical protein [Domibacillus tundrae]|uniref:hypothetical protein n=1 Tax=Domibacillus tundrae TaxID=1587527 RepID=UPI0033985657